MIVLTDGESHDGEELKDALEECEERNVTRYAIAVSVPAEGEADRQGGCQLSGLANAPLRKLYSFGVP